MYFGTQCQSLNQIIYTVGHRTRTFVWRLIWCVFCSQNPMLRMLRCRWFLMHIKIGLFSKRQRLRSCWNPRRSHKCLEHGTHLNVLLFFSHRIAKFDFSIVLSKCGESNFDKFTSHLLRFGLHETADHLWQNHSNLLSLVLSHYQQLVKCSWCSVMLFFLFFMQLHILLLLEGMDLLPFYFVPSMKFSFELHFLLHKQWNQK